MGSFLLPAAQTCLSGHLLVGNRTSRSLSMCNGTAAHAAMNRKGESFQVEIVLREEDNPEIALRLFRNASRGSNVVMEARRRGHFENTQDRKKRKMKEGHVKKAMERKFKRRESTMYEQSNAMEPPPFSDMFGGNTDIFAEGEPTLTALRR
eukprot:jgi/Botrbrau1/10710/Bobra.357_1s0012.1